MFAPILLVAYNRPTKLKILLDSLCICEEAPLTKVYISIDGNKIGRLTDHIMKKEIYEIINKYKRSFQEIVINEEVNNLGLADHIVKSINWVFETNDRAIILEDDIKIISKSFLSYMNTTLDKFDNTDVFQVSAYSYPVDNNQTEKLQFDVFKIKSLSCWGWGTWKDKWKYYNHNIENHYAYWSKNKSRKRQFDILGSAHFFGQLERNYKGTMYSWAVRWYASWMVKNGYSLFPKFSLVQNVGMDGSGTFTSNTLKYQVATRDFRVNSYEVSMDESYRLKAQFDLFFKNTANKKQNNSIRRKISIPIKVLRGRLFNFVRNVTEDRKSSVKIQHCTIFQPTKIGRNVSLYDVVLKEYSYISDKTQISHAVIGKFCSIGPNCMIGWGVHPLEGFSTAPMFYSTWKQNGITLTEVNKVEDRRIIEIGNDVFIGMNVVILDGVKIGNGAVIGAGAVVSKDIPAYAIAIGNPIRILRFRFDESTIIKLENSKWWDSDLNKLQEMEKHFFDIDIILKII
jgi:acetyltransferase-like isoleucine patch superfamily enzyme